MNLSELDADQRARVLRGARPSTFARGDVLYNPDDDAANIYAIETGRVKILRTSPSGGETIVGIRTAGDLFGELSWMERSARRATSAVTIEPAAIWVLPAAEFAAILQADPAIARVFARGVARRLGEAVHELAELAGKSVPGRLVDVLGRLAAEHGVDEPGGTVRIALNLTHKDLADLIGTSRETLTKELGVLADVGLLRVAHKTITLLQPQAFPFAMQRRVVR